MSRFIVQDRAEENTEDKYHQHSLAFYSVWLSEADRASFTQFLLCFGLSDVMKYSVVKDFKESDGLIMSGGAFEVYGVLAKTITSCAEEATRRLERAICDMAEVSPAYSYTIISNQITSSSSDSEQSLTPKLKNQSIVNECLSVDPQGRCRLLLDKYEKINDLSKKFIQARESLTATEQTFSSINKYAENFNERWSPNAQICLKKRIKVLKQYGKAIHRIGKRTGSCKRRLDHEIKLVSPDSGI